MKRFKSWQISIRIMLAITLMGTTFQLGCLNTLIRNANPCGTIIACDPLEFDLLFANIPDFELDPLCTIPGGCGGTPFPPVGGGGTAQTTTTTPTTTTGTTTSSLLNLST